MEKTIDKLKEPDVLVYIGKCFTSGMNYSEISKQVLTKFGIKSDYAQVKKIISIFQNRKSDLIKGNSEFQGMIKGVIINTETELKRIHTECLDILDEAKRIKNFNARLAAIREIRGLLELQDKLLSRLSNKIDTSKINKLEMTQIIVNSLDDLEKQGIIKILKNPNEPMDTIGIDSEYILEEEGEKENEDKENETKKEKKKMQVLQ